MHLKSAGVEANGSTKPNVFCGWGMTWLPLEWEPAPDGTKDLAVYLGLYKYVRENGARKLAIPYAVLLHNIDPSVRSLPVNAFLARARWSGFGPQSCPVAIRGKRVVVEVFALDRHQFEWTMRKRLALRLTEEALADPHPDAIPQSAGKLTRNAIGIGRLITTYPGPHDQL